MTDEIILVDHLDNEIGFTEKDPCHRIPVRLHRAFSIFIVNDRGHMLIQKRSSSKDMAGILVNACCSHPRKGESLVQATSRRLDEELGLHALCSISRPFVMRQPMIKNLESMK